MKRLLLMCTLFAVGLTFSKPVYSQGVWGAEAGVNFANIKGDDISDDTDTRTGLLLAVYYQYALGNTPIVLQPELMYSQKGLTFGDVTVKLDYIVAAALAAYYFDVSEQLTAFIKAGPYVGFNIIAKEDFGGQEEDLDEVSSTDAGVIIRAGVQVDRFEAGLRLARGLTDIFEDADGKNSLFGIFVGINF